MRRTYRGSVCSGAWGLQPCDVKKTGREEKSRARVSAAPKPLAQIYAEHQGELFAFVRGKVGSGPPDPDDIVQQAFANYAASDNRAAILNPIAFLVRTAGNLTHDHFRRFATRFNVSADSGALDKMIQTHDELSPEIVVLGRERFSIVMRALNSLPIRQRRFLLLNRI